MLTEIIYQTLGILALIASFISFQMKTNKSFLIFQSLACLSWAISFMIIKAWIPALMNSVCVVRSIFYYYNKNKLTNIIGTIFFVLTFNLIGLFSAIFLKEKWFIALVCALGSTASTIFISTNNNNLLQFGQFFIISPCWLFNNIYYFSIGAILGEVSNLVSSGITIFRRFILKKK